MDKIVRVGNLIIPEAYELLQKRYSILKAISLDEPIGRRALAGKLGDTERGIRKETDFLKDRKLIDALAAGMVLTKEGKKLLEDLFDLMEKYLGFDEMAEKLALAHGLRKVIIVPGDSDSDSEVSDDLGKVAAEYLSEILNDKQILALTGGSTIKKMVDRIPNSTLVEGLTIVPARGAVGKFYELQANTLVGRLAEKTGSSYKLLNIPENLSEVTTRAILKDKDVKETLKFIKNAQVVVAGIGNAVTTFERRGTGDEQGRKLIQSSGVGEFFGSYFDRNKKVIKTAVTVGLDIEDLKKVKEVIILSAGSKKGEAIAAVDFKGLSATLITDYGAAKKMFEML